MRWILGFAFYILPPLIALLLATPVASMLAPWNWPYVTLDWFMWMILMPFYFGILAAPGYIYAWRTHARSRDVSKGVRLWIRSSLVIALLCSVYGVFAGYWMIWFSPPALLSVFASARLFHLFEAS